MSPEQFHNRVNDLLDADVPLEEAIQQVGQSMSGKRVQCLCCGQWNAGACPTPHQPVAA
jgi:hypothetical protein